MTAAVSFFFVLSFALVFHTKRSMKWFLINNRGNNNKMKKKLKERNWCSATEIVYGINLVKQVLLFWLLAALANCWQRNAKCILIEVDLWEVLLDTYTSQVSARMTEIHCLFVAPLFCYWCYALQSATKVAISIVSNINGQARSSNIVCLILVWIYYFW